MAVAGRAAARAVEAASQRALPGANLLELEQVARETLAAEGARPALLNYKPPFAAETYEFATCLSLNDEVIHGLPRVYVLQEGDVLGIDLAAEVDGWYGDTCVTVAVGRISPAARRLIDVTRHSLQVGLEFCRPGRTLGDIGHAIERYVRKHGLSPMRNICGHGIGRSLHEEGLDVFNYGKPGRGTRLQPGMTFCLEPMITTGRGEPASRRGEPWPVVTADRHPGAHFEHTIAITEDGPLILTLP